MAEITAELVKKLRDSTNVSMMECKRALVETDGNMEKATRLLRERGMAVAAKRADKTTNQGVIAAASAADGRTFALAEVNCETDFVARNESFKAFATHVAAQGCTTDAPLGEQLKNEIGAQMAQIGENIVVRRHVRYILTGQGRIHSYIHLGGKVGVLVELGCDKPATADDPRFKELALDLTLHVAASNPAYLAPPDVPAAKLAEEREIYAKQVKDKPPQVVEKIVDGKIKKFYGEVCLLEQGFVKEPKKPVRTLLTEKGKELDDTLSVRRFIRYQLGE